MDAGAVLTEVRDGKGYITINRPRQLNAIDWDTFFMFQSALEDFISDKEVRVIIITGSGDRSFISGGDVEEEVKMGAMEAYRWSLTGHKLCATIEASPKPVIAAVNGWCLGGGFEIALSCDFIICSDNAQFGAPESKLGVCCGFGGNIRLPRVIGKRKAKEYLMTGRFIKSDEAYRLNLVNKVVPQNLLTETVDEFCSDLLDKSANVLDFIKRITDYGYETDLRSAAQYEAGMFGLISGTHDKFEGMNAFLEKRSPDFIDD